MELHDIFPSLLGKTVTEVNLNTEARLYLQDQGVIDILGNWLRKNPLTSPDVCGTFINFVHKKYGTEFSYGGYTEQRDILWHGTYLDTLGFWAHLGVDINVPAGSALISPISGKILVSDHDSDHPNAPQYHGWGNRLIIEPEVGEYALILAHLSSDSRRRIGTSIKKGEILGTIGRKDENGGWFEHFHIQSIALSKIQKLIQDNTLDTLDGYAESNDANIAMFYPNPFSTF